MTLDSTGRPIAPDQMQLDPAPRHYEVSAHAVFAFHQPDYQGGSFPVYHIVGGPSDRSTVTAETLTRMGIEVPRA